MTFIRTTQRLLPLLPILVLFGGCAATPPPQESYRPTMPPAYTHTESDNGSIYQAMHDVRLFEDVKARRIGDVITVILQENTSATKLASAAADKDQSTDVANPILFGAAPQFNLPSFLPLDNTKDNTLEQALSASRSFEGEADASQSNSLNGAITATIADVLPNGNLVVRGEKWLTLNQGEEYIQISGIVRPQDVSPNNSVLSTQIGDARITYSGKGFLHDSNSMGWLARFFNSPIWPF